MASQYETSAELYTAIRKAAGERAEGLYTNPMYESIIQAAEDTLLDVFQTSCRTDKGGLNYSFHVFIAHVLTGTAHNSALDDFFS